MTAPVPSAPAARARPPASTTITLARLKWRLVANTVNRTGGVWWAAISILTSAAGAIGGFWWFAAARGGGETELLTTAVLGCSAIFFAWLLGSVFILGVDETIDPARIASLPLSAADLRNGMLLTSVIGPAPAAVAVALTGYVAGYAQPDVGLVAVMLVPPTVFVMSVAVSRAVATFLTLVQRSRRGRDLAVGIGAMASVAFMVLIQLASDPENREAMARVLKWSPPGWAGQALVNAERGDAFAAFGWLVPAMAFAVALVVAWFALLTRLLNDTGGAVMASPIAAVPTRGALSGTVDAGPVRAVAAKEWAYLVRSPHRRTGVVVGTVVGGGFIILQALARGEVSDTSVFSAPVATLFMAGSANNQLGFDAGSFWMEVSSGIPGRVLLAGRNVIWAASLMVPALLAGVILAALGGGWRYFPLMMLATLVLLPVVVGIGSWASVTAPFPVPENASPFGNREAMSGRGCALGIIGMVSLMIVVACFLPGALAIALVVDSAAWKQGAVLAGVGAYAMVVWRIAVTRAARKIDERGPELLAAMNLRGVS